MLCSKLVQTSQLDDNFVNTLSTLLLTLLTLLLSRKLCFSYHRPIFAPLLSDVDDGAQHIPVWTDNLLWGKKRDGSHSRTGRKREDGRLLSKEMDWKALDLLSSWNWRKSSCWIRQSRSWRLHMPLSHWSEDWKNVTVDIDQPNCSCCWCVVK